MAIHQAKLGRIRAALEGGTYGAEVSIGSFFDFPWIEDSATIELLQEIQNPQHAQQLLDGMSVGVLVTKEARITLSVNLQAPDTKALSGVAAATYWLPKLLSSWFGLLLSTGTTVNGTSSTTTVVNFTSASTYRPGGAYAIRNPITGLFEAREIKAIATNAVSPKMAHAAAPVTAGWDIMGCASLYLDPRPGQSPQYLQFACEGPHPSDRWLIRGAWLESITIEGGSPKELPKLKLVYRGPVWASADGSNTTMNLVGAALGLATYADTQTIPVKASELYFGTVGSTTIPSFANASKIEITPNIVCKELRTPGGIETIFGARRIHQPPVCTVALTLPFEDLSLFTSRDNLDARRLHYQIGTSAAKGGSLISLRALQIMDVQRAPEEGLGYQKVTALARLDSEATITGSDGSTDQAIGKSALALHLF